MTYLEAVALLRRQDRNIRKVNGMRFVHNGYEYKATYFGGFGAYVGIDRRRVGKRNFKYFGGVSADRCMTVEDVCKLIMEEIEKKA